MKIAHVCPFYTPAICGVKNVVEELAKYQIHEGNEVHVFTSDWDKNKRIEKKYELLDQVHVHRSFHLVRLTSFVSLWPSVFLELIDKNFDIIHTHEFGHPHVVLAALVARIRHIPHVHTTHCPWSNAYRSPIARMGIFMSYNLVSRYVLAHTEQIIAITPWEIDFIKKYGGTAEKIRVLPNGMNSLFFQRIAKNNFKKKYKIGGNLVLFFGRLNVTKGPDRFVEIAHSVLKERPKTFFVIRGPDEGMKKRVQELISGEKRIILLEPTRDRLDIVGMYQAADIFVLPSYREGLPLTLFEAMASGLPIVATPVNGVPYEMKEPDNGFLVPYGDNKRFAQRIITLLDNSSLRSTIGKRNKEKALHYQWEDIAQRTMQFYFDAIQKSKERN